MIGRILHIARREWLEQRRQPATLGVVATLFVIVAALALTAVALLDHIGGSAERLVTLEVVLGESVDGAVALEAMAQTAVAVYNFLLFTQFLGIAAVFAGHAVLHDRQCGTLTFLLLAPVRRAELLLGKVLGAIGPSFLLYLLISGGASVLAASFPVTHAHAAYLPTSPAWWVAFLAGGPLWAVFIGTVCTVVSSVARDVRAAQQAVWFVVFFATFVCGFLLTYSLPHGVLTQCAVALLAGVGSAIALATGSSIISRDLSR